MLQLLNLTDETAATDLHALQRAAYLQEAQLIAYADLPPLRESVADLVALQEQVLGWREGSALLGAIGYQVTAAHIEICRLVVRPGSQRRGIARTLLKAVIESAGTHPVRVATAAANTPALSLYQGSGFRVVQQTQTPDGLVLVHLSRP